VNFVVRKSLVSFCYIRGYVIGLAVNLINSNCSTGTALLVKSTRILSALRSILSSDRIHPIGG
jgi:hypothetical protein